MMIKVVITKRQDTILKVQISGHAHSAQRGKDLVCAGVSSISIGALNAIDALAAKSCDLVMDDGWIEIKVKENSDTLQTILNTLILQLQTIENMHKKFIKMIKQEV